MARTCCPQYTIRHDARAFKPDKKHRAVINRFNRYLETGTKEVQAFGSGSGGITSGSGSGSGSGKAKGKGKAEPYDWMTELHRYEAHEGQGGKRVFEVSCSDRAQGVTELRAHSTAGAGARQIDCSDV